MPIPIRMTPRQARKYSFTGEQKSEKKPQNPMTSRQDARKIEKGQESISCAIGEKWRVAKGLQPVFGTNAPLIGTVFTVYRLTAIRAYLECDGYRFDVSLGTLREYFEREETETP